MKVTLATSISSVRPLSIHELEFYRQKGVTGLAQKIKEGCELDGMVGFVHSTVGVSDGMTQVSLVPSNRTYGRILQSCADAG